MKINEKSVILIVDDKPANIYALQKLLDKKDRTFLEATNGKDALQMALNNNVDLIILDVQMPHMDGFEVASILKSKKRTQDIPIIFATAEKKEQKSILKGFEEGGTDYLSKPLDPEVTKAKVAVLLKIQMQRKELLEKNRSLEKSALLINNSADIIGIIDATSYQIEEMNKAFTTILGYSQEETKGTPLTLYLSNEDRGLLPVLHAKTNEQLSFETRIYCKNRMIKWLAWRVIVKEGKWYANARDITDIKQVEKIRNYLATVVKQSKDAIYIHDNEGKIISWNEGAENIYGYTEAEALKMNIWNIIPERLMDEMHEIVNGIIAGNKVEALETKRINRNGQLLDVLFSASVITDASTGQKSIAITERDVTQQKITGEQIKQLNADLQKGMAEIGESNKELEAFSYSVSHDLRAPLRVISGYSRMLEEDYPELLDDGAKRLLINIQKSAHRMGRLIDDLLTFSKLGRKEIRKAKTAMQDLIKNALHEIGTLTPYKAEVRINEILPVEADHSLMYQVWINLISNAIKYSNKKEKPLVEIGSYAKDTEVVYYVKDNGAGFSMQYVNKLFNVFQRLHGNQEFEGTGIGLAIVQRIVSKHGGKVWAEGVINEGATFYFSIPLNNS
ncbi:MAG: arcB [Bacteroidota bacterium]|nr:arcB [Bacteroidota bacterium]